MGWFDFDDDKYEWLGGDPADPFNYAPKDDDIGCGTILGVILTLIILLFIFFHL